MTEHTLPILLFVGNLKTLLRDTPDVPGRLAFEFDAVWEALFGARGTNGSAFAPHPSGIIPR